MNERKIRMKLDERTFGLEVISRTEFIDDYSYSDKKYLVTIWNIHMSRGALDGYLESAPPPEYWEDSYNTEEEYLEDKAFKAGLREDWERTVREILGEQGDAAVAIRQLVAEFFSAIKIERYEGQEHI